MSNKNKDIPNESDSKSIHSENLKRLNMLKEEANNKKRSHSVKSISQQKKRTKINNNVLDRKNTEESSFNINIQEFIKDAQTAKKEPQNTSKMMVNSQDFSHKMIKTKTNNDSAVLVRKDVNSYLYNEMQRKKYEDVQNRMIYREMRGKEQRDSYKKTYRETSGGNLQQSITKTNPFNKYNRRGIRISTKIDLSNVYKTQDMTGNIIDYMMIFKQRDTPQYLTEEGAQNPIMLLRRKKDEPSSPYKIEINLLPKKSEKDIHINEATDPKNKDRKQFKSFLPRNIAEKFIHRKNKIIESILGSKEYNELFQKKITLNNINEIDEPNEEQQSSNNNIANDNYLNISSYSIQEIMNNDPSFHMKTNSSKKSKSYFEKYNSIEHKLKFAKPVN